MILTEIVLKFCQSRLVELKDHLLNRRSEFSIDHVNNYFLRKQNLNWVFFDIVDSFFYFKIGFKIMHIAAFTKFK